MARYSDSELDAIKKSVDLAALIQSKGIKLEPHGREHLKGICPFHDDKNPSMIVTPAKGLWNCPSCSEGGDVIRFVQKHDGVSFRHAVEVLKENTTAAVGGKKRQPGSSRKRKLKPLVALDADDNKQLRDVVDYYHERLKTTEPAKQYLKSRGIYCEEAIDRFKIGYADRTLGLRIPEKSWREGKQLREQLKKIGILREGTGHEHLNGCLTIPILAAEPRSGDLENGFAAVTEVYGRKITQGLRKGTARHMYLPGPHRGVWNADGIKNQSEVILCESLIDALTFWTCGLRNVTASYGTGGFTKDHLDAFLDNQIARVYIAYDRDNAGDTAAKKLAAELTAEGIRCHRVLFPRGMDANAYAQQATPVRKHLELLLKSAQLMTIEKPKSADSATRQPVAPAAQHVAPATEVAAPSCSPKSKAETSVATQSAPKNCGDRRGTQSPSPSETPKPSKARPDIPCEQRGEDLIITLGNRAYRVRGLAKNQSYDVMKVNVRLSVLEGGKGACGSFHVDTFDLYNARHRKAFLHVAADECKLDPDTVKRDLGRVLLKLEEMQEKNLADEDETEAAEVELSDEERAEALEMLRSPQLLQRIASDFELAGLVGEEANALVAYLAAVSRKTDDPLAVIIQSSSSAGKSAVMDAILRFMPDEEQIRYTAMTGQSLFYMGETELAHKILAISEEEGAEQAGYALKILQSEKRLKIASTGKDPKSGRLVTQEYYVEGPCVIFMTTTNIEIDEELQNRCLVLTVNENREQTRRIHQLQRQSRTLAGLLRNEDKKTVLRVHQNAQRLLRPLLVVNPFAERLTFADARLRTRRDHMKYLNLISAVTLLHQHQREVRTVDHNGQQLEYVEVTLDDVEAANRLAGAVLGTSLDDLPPQTRRLLDAITQLVSDTCKEHELDQRDYRFTRRDLAAVSGWGNTQLKIHLARLVDHEYLIVHPIGAQRYGYELVYHGEGQDGKRFVMNLIDTQKLRAECEYDANRSGQSGDRSAPGRGAVGGWSQSAESADLASKNEENPRCGAESAEITIQGPQKLPPNRHNPPAKEQAS